MQINIKVTNIELTPAIKDHIQKKLNSLDKFIDSRQAETLAFVEVGKITKHHRTGNVFRAEIQLKHHDFKNNPRSVIENQDLYAAIDEAREQIKRELTETKEKKRTLVQKGARLFKKIIYEAVGKRFD